MYRYVQFGMLTQGKAWETLSFPNDNDAMGVCHCLRL